MVLKYLRAKVSSNPYKVKKILNIYKEFDKYFDDTLKKINTGEILALPHETNNLCLSKLISSFCVNSLEKRLDTIEN